MKENTTEIEMIKQVLQTLKRDLLFTFYLNAGCNLFAHYDLCETKLFVEKKMSRTIFQANLKPTKKRNNLSFFHLGNWKLVNRKNCSLKFAKLFFITSSNIPHFVGAFQHFMINHFNFKFCVKIIKKLLSVDRTRIINLNFNKMHFKANAQDTRT